MPAWLKFLLEALPIFGEWLKWVLNMQDEEWEDISKAWPAPTKTRLAKLRYEAKKQEAFFAEKEDGD